MTTPTLIDLIQAARDVERYEGENASFAYGLTNCARCKKLSRDYLIIGIATPVCTECASFQESYRLGKCHGVNSTHDRLAPALICAVEALESGLYKSCECHLLKNTNVCQSCGNRHALDRIRSLLTPATGVEDDSTGESEE